MSDQVTFASMAWGHKGKVTRRERFLAEMDAVVPWRELVAVIAPYYPKPGRGRPPMPLERMLRLYFVQQWFDLSDPQAEDMVYDSESIRRFVGVELGDEAVPDETTILHFRHLLERHRLTEQIFAAVRALLEERRLLLKAGTIVDATIISAPSSTKNAAQQRDPEMRQARKGNTWYFGMKLHVGTDRRGIVHSMTATHAAVHDASQVPALLHGAETVLYGDRAYWSGAARAHYERAGVRFRVNRRGAPHAPLSAGWHRINRARSRIRARGEHAFHVVKRLWGFTKVRYRGVAKNAARAFTLFALANVYLLRYRLRPAGAPCLR
jgi:IS5 family transposase